MTHICKDIIRGKGRVSAGMSRGEPASFTSTPCVKCPALVRRGRVFLAAGFNALRSRCGGLRDSIPAEGNT